MRFPSASIAFLLASCDAFAPQHARNSRKTARSSTTELYANRKARRAGQKNQNKKKPANQQALGEATNTATTSSPPRQEETSSSSSLPVSTPEPGVLEAVEIEKPSVSRFIEDENGLKRIADGKSVMDVTTGQAVKLSPYGPEYRLAEMFPGVPPNVRSSLRFDRSTVEPMQLLEGLKKAVVGPDGKIPGKKVTDAGLDYMIANRDLLGEGMKKMIGRLKLKNQSEMKLDEARFYRDLWFHYMVLEQKISAPFRQIVLDAEMKIGPNFGNLDVKSYCGGEMYERAGAFIVFKAMVALWEKKVVDARDIEETPRTRQNFIELLCIGDPKRYLPNSTTIWKMDECAKICLMAQKLSDAFVSEPELFDDLPVELRFIEAATKITDGTELRRFMIEDFCPKEEITPEGLREGMRRVVCQCQQMQIDSYGDFTILIEKLSDAIAKGSPDERDPYFDWNYNPDADAPGYFQTYTFDHDINSMVRFLDNAKTVEEGSMGPTEEIVNQFQVGMNFFQDNEKAEREEKYRLKKQNVIDDGPYEPPEKRAIGRPHMMGWLEALDDDYGENKGYSDPQKFEADDWEEIPSN
mmetsp:Transcript_12752/g.19256  ORF Transcript_12752/g.19256 Transcript_12752/m.19256 type:complete len:580 (-) Transcript_12752:35-1774(-)